MKGQLSVKVLRKKQNSYATAFYIAFMVVTSKKGMSSYELSRKLSWGKKHAGLLNKKVIEAMNSGGNNPLKGDIEVDEFNVGGLRLSAQPKHYQRGRCTHLWY
jgi:hypothetical protein